MSIASLSALSFCHRINPLTTFFLRPVASDYRPPLPLLLLPKWVYLGHPYQNVWATFPTTIQAATIVSRHHDESSSLLSPPPATVPLFVRDACLKKSLPSPPPLQVPPSHHRLRPSSQTRTLSITYSKTKTKTCAQPVLRPTPPTTPRLRLRAAMHSICSA